MPYIREERRVALEDWPYAADNVGELNYMISTIVWDYLCAKGINYDNLNGVVGVLECAKQELYRRIVVPYEDHKMKENGDVYE